MNGIKWIIFAIIGVGIIAALVLFSSSSKIDVTNIDTSKVLAASAESGEIADQVLGNANSPVILVEYADFQCPGCQTAYPRIKAIVEQYQQQIGFVFRNFPLTSIHPNALAAAAAAEAAGLQGKFWEMADLLFTNQSGWSKLDSSERLDKFSEYASSLGLDVDQFKTDMSSEKVSKKIRLDQALGKKDEVSGTPGFYLNGEKLEQEIWGDDAKLKELLDQKLKEAGIDPPTSSE